MSEFHQQLSVSDTKEVMFQIYNFVTHASQNVVDFTVDNTFTALWVDNAEGGGTPDLYKTSVATKEAFGNNSFMVLEVQFANPGGRTWQIKITRVSAVRIDIEASPNGGFTIVNSTSGATDGFGAEPTTGPQQWFGTLPAAGDSLYLSSADLDTYGTSDKYGWFRLLYHDLAPGTVAWGFYAGGYIPLDETNDTDPFICLVANPTLLRSANYGWGRVSTDALNRNRLPVENGAAVTSLVAAGYGCLSCNQAVTQYSDGLTRAGTHVEMQIFVHGISNGECVGYLGDKTMVGLADSVTMFSVNTAGTRIALNNIGHRWVP
jgi:hypothetical protein